MSSRRSVGICTNILIRIIILDDSLMIHVICEFILITDLNIRLIREDVTQ